MILWASGLAGSAASASMASASIARLRNWSLNGAEVVRLDAEGGADRQFGVAQRDVGVGRAADDGVRELTARDRVVVRPGVDGHAVEVREFHRVDAAQVDGVRLGIALDDNGL